MSSKFKQITETIKKQSSKNVEDLNKKQSKKTILNIQVNDLNLNRNKNENQKNVKDDLLSKNTSKLDLGAVDSNIQVNLQEFTSKLIVKKDKILEEINENNIGKIILETECKHPRMLKNGKLDYLPFCGTHTGWFGFCCRNSQKSDLSIYGMAVNAYFKIVKSLILVFLIISILNIPLYAMYYYNSLYLDVKDYRDALFKTTIGNIASSKFLNFNIDYY